MIKSNLPKRPLSHVLESKSEKHLLNSIPDSWTYEKKTYDYGIDYEIEIFDREYTTGKKFLIQLKAHGSIPLLNNVIKQKIKTSALNYYLSLDLETVLFVYNSARKEMYHLFIKSYIKQVLDYFNPNWKNFKTISVEVPIKWSLEKSKYSYSPIEEVRNYISDEKIKNVLNIKQLILISYARRSKKGNSLLFQLLEEAQNPEIISLILDCKDFIKSEPKLKAKLLEYLDHADITIVNKAVGLLQYFPSPEVTEKLLIRYIHLYEYDQINADWEKFKECVGLMINSLVASNEFENRKVLNVILSEFCDPLRNWTGQMAGDAILLWWNNFSLETRTYVHEKIVHSKNDIYHTFNENDSTVGIIRHVVEIDYREGFK